MLMITDLAIDVLELDNGIALLCLLQHLLVPILKSLRLWHFLFRWVTVEDVIVAFGRWTCPNVGPDEAHFTRVIEIAFGWRVLILNQNIEQNNTH